MTTLQNILEVNIAVIPFGISLALSISIIQLCRTWWRLRHVPGPFPACITNFQRVLWVKTKRAHLILQDMHEKYGEVIRIGPNMVTFNNPEAIPTVYTTRTGFPKVSKLISKVITERLVVYPS
jgi:hypothetical protein